MKLTKYILLFFLVAILSCKKKNSENYSSVDDFLSKNAPAIQTYTINGSTGGNFTTPQGTIVTIPANAFVTQSNVPVTGNVTIEFKDLFKKSDMLFSNKQTAIYGGAPLKSGGEFYIKAIANNSEVDLASGKSIAVSLPAANTGGMDTLNPQQSYVFVTDSISMWSGWIRNIVDTVVAVNELYAYSLRHFSPPLIIGTWLNSDNASFFKAYPQTKLTFIPNDKISTYNPSAFLVFKNISTVVRLSIDGSNLSFNYAPQGLECTFVAVGIKDGNPYSSIVPLTISANQSVKFTLEKTTTEEFKTKLNELN